MTDATPPTPPTQGSASADWPRPLVHFEIEARDPQRQREFYAALFNWDITDGPIMNTSTGIGSPIDGIGGHIRQSNRSAFNLYFQVRDLASSLAKTVALGGSVETEPFQFPGTPTMAVIADPEGNTIVFVQQ